MKDAVYFFNGEFQFQGKPLAIFGAFCSAICAAKEASTASLSTPLAHIHPKTVSFVREAYGMVAVPSLHEQVLYTDAE